MIEKHFATYVDRDELIGIGYEGIIKAADKFDKSKNIKFCTFACKCIHNEILMKKLQKAIEKTT